MSDVLKTSVLVVDDYKTMRFIRLLNQIGFTDIDEAADGGEALDKLKKKQ